MRRIIIIIKKVLLCLFILILFLSEGILFAGNNSNYSDEKKFTMIQIASYYPFQLFDDNYDVYGLRFNVVYGKNWNIYGIDFGLFNQ